MTDPTSLPEPSPRELVHRALRAQLAAYALAELGEVESAAVAAHLDDCAACRAELAEITPPASDRPLVGAERAEAAPTPPPDLDDHAVTGVTDERAALAPRSRGRAVGRALGLVAAASLLVAAGVAAGTQLVEPREVVRTAPVPTPVTDPVEPLRWAATGVAVTKVGLVSRPWGLEVRLEGSGFAEGEVYRAVVRTKLGRDLAAGEFLGTGDRRLVCTLQAAVLRDAASGFSIVDAQGVPVVQSRFPRT